MLDDAEFDEPVPEVVRKLGREFVAADPRQCPGCGGWEGVVMQINDRGTHARMFCATPHLAKPEDALERTKYVAAALQVASAMEMGIVPSGASLN